MSDFLPKTKKEMWKSFSNGVYNAKSTWIALRSKAPEVGWYQMVWYKHHVPRCKPNRPSFFWFGKSMSQTYISVYHSLWHCNRWYLIFRVSVLGVEKESYQYVFLFRVR